MSEMGNVTPIASSLHHYRLSWITTSSRVGRFISAAQMAFIDALEILWKTFGLL
jgi:hypothetical protein